MNLAGRRHRGVDFKTDVGTPVVAPYKSKVMRRNWNTLRNGKCLELRYVDLGINAFFLHLDEVLPAAVPGNTVEAGTLLARTGNTGHSTAPHLHYELHGKNNRLLDPFDVGETTRKLLEGKDLARFNAKRDRYDRILSGAGSSRESSGQPNASTTSKTKK